ncbi:translation initiation/elongation factor MRX8 [Aspergillus lucknowensis]|uniref:GTP-binding protein 8 n=1 Tax=Aspergillus lucknowensis TaxID=176173 RepID=A0ABR4LZ97_9EURO
MRSSSFVCYSCRQALSSRIPHRTITSTTTACEQPKIPPLRDLTPGDISYYWDTKIPTQSQLQYADKIFAPSHHSPIKLWSASKFRTTPLSSIEPEVAFLGRSNVGKSSLLNAIMGKKICWTSSKPGRTREMNAFGIGGTKGGESKVVLLDMPGYGKASRPEWGVEIMKYLQGRKQLRRAFLLIDGEHGIKSTDDAILNLFRQYAIPHQVILSKVDKLILKKQAKPTSVPSAQKLTNLRATLERLRPVLQPDGRNEGPGALGELLTCSSQTNIGDGRYLGISSIRWAILSAAGLDGIVEAKGELNPSADSRTSTLGNAS